MIKVELLSPNYNGETVEWQRLALLHAEGREVTWFEGDRDLVDLSVPVIDLRARQSLRYDDDPEEWVRGLPTIFRGGDIVVHVIEDTNPLPSDLQAMPSNGDAPITVEPTADVGAHA